jgi:hypothetical protein
MLEDTVTSKISTQKLYIYPVCKFNLQVAFFHWMVHAQVMAENRWVNRFFATSKRVSLQATFFAATYLRKVPIF